jgi:exodeoxyribonuclease V beta subunit
MTREFRNLEPLGPGVTLIEASAGTGKTYTITALALRLVIEEELPIERMLVVTFTEAATAELQHRIRTRLRDALGTIERIGALPSSGTVAAEDVPGGIDDEVLRQVLVSRGVLTPGPDDGELPVPPQGAPRRADFLTRARHGLSMAVTGFDQAAISTIHGFCQRTLRENAFESGIVFDTELVGDPIELVTEVVTDYWVNRQHAGDRGFLRYVQSKKVTPETLINLVRNALRDPQMPVLPEHVDVSSGPSFADWTAAFIEARDQWKREHQEAVRLIDEAVTAKRLHGGSYRADHVAKRVAAVSGYFAGDPELLTSPPDNLDFFTHRAIVDKTNSGAVPLAHPLFDTMESFRETWTALEQSLDTHLLALRREVVDYARVEVPRRKRIAQVQSFDDLLNLLDAALDGPSGESLADAVRSRYAVALIDEFQDTDPVQYRIFSRIFASPEARASNRRLFLIGDPKQAIYAFRGADIFAYIRAAASAANRKTLGTNWRSTPQLVEAVNTVFSRSPQPFRLPEISFQRVAPKPGRAETFRVGDVVPAPFVISLRPKSLPGQQDYGRNTRFPSPAHCVAASIVKLLQSESVLDVPDKGETKRVAPGDIAVLVRSKRQGREVRDALQQRLVPCVIQDGTSVYESEDAADIETLLRALLEPTRLPLVRAALVTNLMGLSGDDLLRLDGDPAAWELAIDLFRQWRDLWLRRGVIHAVRAVISQRTRFRDPDRLESPPAHLLRLLDGERRMTNLLHLAELLHETEVRERMAPAALVRWLGTRRTESRDDDSAQLRMESDASAVKIMTIHKSKGLEFPIVYCPYLSQEAKLFDSDRDALQYHDPADEHRLKLSLDPDKSAEAQALHERFAEDMRLLYVALTRARVRCVAYWDAGGWRNQYSAFAWLLFARAGESVADFQSRMGSLDEDDQFEQLSAIEAASDGAVHVNRLSPNIDVSLSRSDGDDVRLEHRSSPSRVLQPWRMTSYSALVVGARGPGPSEAGFDYALDASAPPTEPPTTGARVTLADAPAGARFGTMVHEVFEKVDFGAVRSAESAAEVARIVALHGFEPSLAGRIHQSVAETVETTLDAHRLRLADVGRGARMDELAFVFPTRARTGVTRERLAAAIETHGGPALEAVAAQVAELEFEPFEGFLKGYIDLTFEHDGRWYIVDYKSNDLGDTRDAYGPDAISHAMHHGAYHLQYLIYAVALRRYLRWRVPGWTWDKNFGGVFYLFVRGVHPDTGPDAGVHFDRPSQALIRALDNALDEGAR